MNEPNLKLVSKLGLIASTISSVKDLKSLTRSINLIVDSIIDVKYNGLYFFDEKKENLILHHAKGFNENERKNAEKTAFERHPGWVIKNKKPLLIHDTQYDNEGNSKDSNRSFVVRSRIWLPILCKNESVGAFGMASLKPNDFSSQHIALLEFVCELAGVVYNNLLLSRKDQLSQQKLVKSKKEFELLFNSNPDAVMLILNNKIAMVNASFMKQFEISNPSLILESNFRALFKNHSKIHVNRILNAIQQTDKIENIALDFLNKSFYADLFFKKVLIGNNDYILLSIRNINKRIEIEQKIRQQEEKSILLRNSAQVPGIVYQSKKNNDGGISYSFYAGKLSDELSTLSKEYDLLNQKVPLFDQVLDLDENEYLKKVLNAEIHLNDFSLDYRIRLPNGSIKWLRRNSVPSLNVSNEIIWNGYITDITQDKIAEEKIASNQKQLNFIFDKAPNAIIFTRQNGRIIRWNPMAEKIFNWTESEAKGSFLHEMVPPENYSRMFKKAIDRIAKDDESNILNNIHELKGINKQGIVFPIQLSISKVSIHQDDYFICFISDISKRKKQEIKIKNALKEKDVLLKEIHHRIKNNMQIISSLMSLQSSFQKDPEIIEIFRAAQYRIHSMGKVHELLYQSKNITRIDFKEYCSQIIYDLIHGIYGQNIKIITNFDIPKISFNLDTSIPLGLIINEIISNALIHGLSNLSGDEISIHLAKKDNLFELIIGDNGKGLSETDFNQSVGLGILLIKKLIYQLNGSVQLIKDKKGCYYSVCFQEV